MEDIKWIDQLKLRAAIGLAGNNRISDDTVSYTHLDVYKRQALWH